MLLMLQLSWRQASGLATQFILSGIEKSSSLSVIGSTRSSVIFSDFLSPTWKGTMIET